MERGDKLKTKKKIIIPAIIIFILFAIFAYYYKFVRTVGSGTIPVITYHSIQDENPENNEYIVETSDFEHMVSLLDKEGFTFLDTYDLLDIVENKKELPKNPILITFDDGYEDNYKNAYPILKKYNAKGTIFVIGSYVGKEGNYLKWDQIKEMSESGVIDIASHSYNLHDVFEDGENKGKTWLSAKLKDESDEHYYEKVKNDLIWNNNLLYEHSSRFPIALAYPGAMTNDLAEKALTDAGMKFGFVGANKSASKLDDLNTYELKRFHIKNNANVENKVRFLHSNN